MNKSEDFRKRKCYFRKQKLSLHLTPLPQYTVSMSSRRDMLYQPAENSLRSFINDVWLYVEEPQAECVLRVTYYTPNGIALLNCSYVW